MLVAEQAKLAQSEMQKAMDTEEESQEDEGRRLKWGSRSQFYGTNQSDQQVKILKPSAVNSWIACSGSDRNG